MLELKKGGEILAAVGGISSLSDAQNVIEQKLDPAQQKKLSLITNGDALIKIANAILMCKPASVFVNSGSPDDIQWI